MSSVGPAAARAHQGLPQGTATSTPGYAGVSPGRVCSSHSPFPAALETLTGWSVSHRRAEYEKEIQESAAAIKAGVLLASQQRTRPNAPSAWPLPSQLWPLILQHLTGPVWASCRPACSCLTMC